MSKRQHDLYTKIKSFVLTPRSQNPQTRLTFSTLSMPARDRKFILDLANSLGISHTIDIIAPLPSPSASAPPVSPLAATSEGDRCIADGYNAAREKHHHIILEWDEDDDESDEESFEARGRVLRKWDSVEVLDEEEIFRKGEEEEKRKIEGMYEEWKRGYYKEKLEIDYDNKEELGKLVFAYVEGLQWVLKYYYEGVASWEWFYPYHYGPKMTDLLNISHLKFTFDIGRPFLPFEQLMGVLPAASGQHIPEAYRDLMTNPNSPILDFYPTEFELDLNGKKQDWEAVVKICFIDEGRLVRALRARENQLTKEERERNRHGSSWIFRYTNEKVDSYRSPLPGVFPDIPSCTCLTLPYTLPTVHPMGYNKHLTPGTLLGSKMLPGFPSLDTLPHTSTLGFHGVRVFQQESPNESMVVTLGNRWEGKSPEDILRSLSKERVFVGWPYLWEAQVDNISDELFRYSLSIGAGGRVDVVKTPLDLKGQERFGKASERVEESYSKRFGTVLGEVEVLVGVRLLKGMRVLEDGALRKEWEDRVGDEGDFAVQSVVVGDEFEDPRYEEKPSPKVEDEFPLASRVFFLGGQGYGLGGEVVGYGETEGVNIKLTKPTTPTLDSHHLSRITMAVRDKAQKEEQWTPSWLLAKQMGMSGLALSKVMSGLHVVQRGGDERWNLGLGLKFEAKGRKVVGWSRKSEGNGGFGRDGGGQWEFGRRAVEVVGEYKAKFPEFFAGLEKRSNRAGDFYEATDFWPDPDVAMQKVAEIREFLKVKGVRDLEKVGLDSVALTKEFVKEIEEKIDEAYEAAGGEEEEKKKVKNVVVKNVPREVILKPSHAKHRLTLQTFTLGDRVVHVLDTGIIPLGHKGTVIGLEKSFLDIVFDRPFMGGNSLEGRCGQQKGMTVHKDAVLNLTNVQPPVKGQEKEQVREIKEGKREFGLQRRGGGEREREVEVRRGPVTPPPRERDDDERSLSSEGSRSVRSGRSASTGSRSRSRDRTRSPSRSRSTYSESRSRSRSPGSGDRSESVSPRSLSPRRRASISHPEVASARDG
ncbi:hypothetical protein HK097_004516, partial [Rhizophlyctis rosea]